MTASQFHKGVITTGPDGQPTAQPLILVRTEAVRAAVGRASAFIFPAKRAADTAALLAAVDAAAAASSRTTRRCSSRTSFAART